jgi:Prolyl oligopeptidase family
MESIRYLIKLGIAEEGPGKQFVSGGSHGGFIAGHRTSFPPYTTRRKKQTSTKSYSTPVIGQYPDFFSAAVIRNPVMSAAEPSVTDIPDWYYAEFGYPYGPTRHMTPQIFQELRAVSPIRHVDNVRTPVLLCIGADDRRVAPTQGIDYYHALKGRSKRVEMLIFKKEGHPLDGVEAARVCYEAGRDWIGRARVGVGRA